MGEQISQLYADGRLLVEHELGFQKRRLKFVGEQSKSASKLFLIATIFLTGGFLALILGTLLALIPVLGAWSATFAVTTGSLLIAVMAFFLAIARVKAIGRVFTTDDSPDTAQSGDGPKTRSVETR